jgi:hypothetical protein
MNKIIIGAYWGPRKESREDSGIRLSHFFNEQSMIDPALAIWELLGPNDAILGTTQTDATRALPDLHSIENENPPIDPRLGRRFRGWKPRGSSFATLTGRLGSTMENNVLIGTREGEFTDEQLKHLFQVTVQVFDPDAAMITGGEMLVATYKRLNEAAALDKFPPISHEPAWCNYKRGTPLSLESFSRG